MKTFFLFVVVCVSLIAAEKNQPDALRQPADWFYSQVHLGQSAGDLAIIDKSKTRPIRLSGAEIRAHVDGFKKDGVKNFVPVSLKNDSLYWYWTQQGPMSDRQMFVVSSGDSFEKSVVVFATIEERACF
jgi:hypothetical protein